MRISETFRLVMRKTALTLLVVRLLPPAPLLPLLRVRLRVIVSAPESRHRRAPARRA